MNEWIAVITALATLLAILGAVLAIADRFTKPMNRLNDSIITLSADFAAQNKNIERMNNANEAAHKLIWETLNEQKKMLAEHGEALAILIDAHDNKQ